MAEFIGWHRISIEVDGELAEALGDVFSRYSDESSVVIESTAVDTSDPDSPGKVIGPLRVSLYLPLDESLDGTLQKIEEALWYLGRIQPLPEVSHTIIQDSNWMESWKQFYHPIRVGRSLLILPAWMENPDPERTPILIDPGMAFGTGAHPTTQLSMQLLETYIHGGENIIDVGSGSGILSITAVKLGCSHALGVDIEMKAEELADKNAVGNGVSQQTEFHRGSVKDILAGKYGYSKAPIVVANILAPILINLFDNGMGELMEKGGVFILSGILLEKENEIMQTLQKYGFFVKERVQNEDWLGLALRKKGS
ncbi:MAG: 50S ribosomal protein L11 methyltransferase [Anaerolineales bacterium]|nr:50S ribosomal protein L11 methyltransferase [Anaerolineales bacterium]